MNFLPQIAQIFADFFKKRGVICGNLRDLREKKIKHNPPQAGAK